MSVEPPSRTPEWVKLRVVHFSRAYHDERLGRVNLLLALFDRILGRIGRPHYHFFTEDRELCGLRLTGGAGALFFAIPDPHGGAPLPGVLESEAEDEEG
jgi:hypothetical protein